MIFCCYYNGFYAENFTSFDFVQESGIILSLWAEQPIETLLSMLETGSETSFLGY